MKTKLIVSVLASCWAISAEVHATVWPQSIGDMKHAWVDFDGADIAVINQDPGPLDLLNHGELHTPPADVLDGKGYNNQYGFANSSAFIPPAGRKVWIEVLSISSGLDVYEGGMRGANVSTHTYDPILDDIGDRWMWNQNMHHPWFAAAAPGLYSAEYRVYIGDETTGEPDLAYGWDTAVFSLSYVPEPASLAWLVLGSIGLCSRRRS